MIQDIAPHTYDNQFNSRRAPRMTDMLLIHRKNQVMVKTEDVGENEIVFPLVGDLPEIKASGRMKIVNSSAAAGNAASIAATADNAVNKASADTETSADNEASADTEASAYNEVSADNEASADTAANAREVVPGVYEFRGQRLIWLFRIDDEAFFGIDRMWMPEEELRAAGSSADTAEEKSVTALANNAENNFNGSHAATYNHKLTYAEFQAAEESYLMKIFQGFSFQPNTICRLGKPGYLSFAGITGSQLYRWRSDHHFCGRCGEKMQTSELERAYVCPRCKATVYPKICPAVIVAVLNHGKILVSKYADRGHYKNYALIAGFAEVGETIEETVHREVMEEVGVKVKNLRFYKSQPWSFSDTLLMGFYCELDGDETIALDRNELAMAAWLTPEELPERSDDISLTAEMMENFRTGKI